MTWMLQFLLMLSTESLPLPDTLYKETMVRKIQFRVSTLHTRVETLNFSCAKETPNYVKLYTVLQP